MRNYHWENTGVTHYSDGSTYIDGYYNFCFDEKGNYNYYIQDVDICFKNLTQEQRQREFKGAKFVWSCTGTHYVPLRADTIEEAKKEFEELYRIMLEREIERLNTEKENAINKLHEFLRYQQSKDAEQKKTGVKK